MTVSESTKAGEVTLFALLTPRFRYKEIGRSRKH